MKIFKHPLVSVPLPATNLAIEVVSRNPEVQELHDIVLPHALNAWEEQAFITDIYTAALIMEDPMNYGPKLRRCKFVSSSIYFNLNSDTRFSQSYSIQYADTYQLTGYGKDTHAFIIATSKQTGKKYLIDAQYLQFVDEQNQDGLPEVMIFEFANNQDLIAGLDEHNMPDRNHGWWLQSEEMLKGAA